MQRARSPSRDVGFTVSATTNAPRTAPSHPAKTDGAAVVGAASGQRRRSGTAPTYAARPDAHRRRRRPSPRRPRPASFANPVGRHELARRARAHRRRSRGRSGARTRPRPSRRAAAASSTSTPGAATTVDQLHPALGDRAGLVEHRGVDRLGRLEHLAALDHDAELRAAPVPTMIAVGVASPSAHGQAMISTATAAVNASSAALPEHAARPRA